MCTCFNLFNPHEVGTVIIAPIVQVRKETRLGKAINW